MHARKMFLRFVGPGDKVEVRLGLDRFPAVYVRRGSTRGNHVVRLLQQPVGRLRRAPTAEEAVHSKQLFEIEGWRVRTLDRTAAAFGIGPLAKTKVSSVREPRTTDYCGRCGESPESGSHLPHGHAYVEPFGPPDTAALEHARRLVAEREASLTRDVIDELYLAMKARRDRFMKSKRTPVPETMNRALRVIARLVGKSAKV